MSSKLVKRHAVPAPLPTSRSAAIVFTDGEIPGTFTCQLLYDGQGVPDHGIGDPTSPTHLSALKAYKRVKALLDASMNPLHDDGSPMEQAGDSDMDRSSNVIPPPQLVQ